LIVAGSNVEKAQSMPCIKVSIQKKTGGFQSKTRFFTESTGKTAFFRGFCKNIAKKMGKIY
jgi:hypothetical protein